MSKRARGRRNLRTIWRGKVARIVAQSSDSEVRTLERLVWHKGMDEHSKFLVLENAILDVAAQRMADREEEARQRRRNRQRPPSE